MAQLRIAYSRGSKKRTRNERQLELGKDVVGLLKTCTATKDLLKGSKLHAYIEEHKYLGRNAYIGTTLVSMYAKCGALSKAQQVLQELPARNAISWNALIGGYAQQGKGEEALKCFDDMIHEGHSPNAATFGCVLKACGVVGAVAKGEEIHDKIMTLGMLKRNVMLGTTLVDMYVKCGALSKAQQVHRELPNHDVISWTALIAGYAQQGQGEEALKCFDDMLCQGHSPTAVTFLCVLKACGSIGATVKGNEIHDKIISLGMLKKSIMLGTTLVDMYVKCGELVKAHQVLEDLPVRDMASWNVLIAAYVEQGLGAEALKCFDDMRQEGHSPTVVTFTCVLKACGSIRAASKGEEIHDQIVSLGMLEKNVVLEVSLVDMYAKSGALTKAQQLHEGLPIRDVVSWSALIAGYAQYGQGEKALKCFDDMLNEGHTPNAVTFACVLKACGSIKAANKGKKIHDKIVSLGMLETDIVLRNSLIDMYVRCGALNMAQLVHNTLHLSNVISWNVLIAGHVEQGRGEEALKCFDDMVHEGHSPNAFTFASALKACGSIGATAKGKEIHDKIISLGMLEKNVALGGILVDMYVKCGALDNAQWVHEELTVRDVVCWNVLIAGYAQQGQNVEAINCLERMQSDGVKPNLISLNAVLNACGHSGLLDKAETYFSAMSTKYGFHPNFEHYCSMTAIFGRAGQFEKALSVIAEMPYDKCLPTWISLLGACRKLAETKTGRLAFERVLHLDKSNAAVYVLMADIYTAAGMQEEARKIEVMRVSNKAWKGLDVVDGLMELERLIPLQLGI